MKKVISILLALIMIFALFACSNQKAGTSSSASPSASQTPAPASSEAPSSAPPSSDAPAGSVDLTKNADEVGFFESGVDPFSRKTYNFVHMYPMTLLLFEKMTDCFNHYGSTRLNCKVTPSTTENDMDKFVQQIQTFADQGDVDGFIMVIDPPTKERILEVLDETNIPYMVWCNSMRDDNGKMLTPCVGLDQKEAAEITVQWLFDNYKNYWGDIDVTQIALLNIDTSLSVDLRERGIGAEEKFKELIPNNAGIFYIDMLTDFTQEFAFNQASAVFSAHPEIKYWFSTNCVEMNSQGVARAVETLGIEDKVLITDVGSDILCSEWETGYDGSWVSCLAISNYLYAAPTISALVAIVDGTTTWENLWTDRRAPGDKYTFYSASSMMVTKDTYKDYFNKYCELAGAPLEYPN